MSDITAMETSQESRGGETGPLQDEPLKKEEGPVKDKKVSSSSGTPLDPKAPGEKADVPPGTDEEPGTFDRVYEHGRQMGF
jgi:hypothetical protein